MKKMYSLVAVAMLATASFAQTTLLSENFGTTSALPSGWTSTSSTNGWNINTASASSGYSGASGGSNAAFAGTGTNGVTHSLTYSNLSTVGYSNINVIWGGRGTSSFNQNVNFQWSTDGTVWNNVTYTYNKNSGTWDLVNGGVAIQLPAGAENASNLRLRWSSVTSNSGNYRIDDVKVVGTSASLATNEVKRNKNLFVKNTVLKSDISFGVTSDVKIFNMAGQVVKTAAVHENQSLNVSDLREGAYIVTGTVNGKAVSEKVIKK
ncbi:MULTISPECIES: T9SS type A sorting domain-containing protein [Chryseobacterium]|uniref:T9SS type A sorting domain-containing protein n=1 Tax=Chryseobacterium candidae TaxID=1978493 RepID=A0ABY2R3U7_9FLAO|nr:MULTISPECIES: T9SS type A sorting domain-containing protein [Chryseobacterium]THV57354.1 T9SS type A sorting domain-containing protein [Chryseobacterium candidae]SIQ63762.1 Por secretion system C-terminal sorting domain-containing protein [Chryseobacterium sp. RU33C]